MVQFGEDSFKDTTYIQNFCCTHSRCLERQGVEEEATHFFQEMEAEEVGPLVGQRN